MSVQSTHKNKKRKLNLKGKLARLSSAGPGSSPGMSSSSALLRDDDLNEKTALPSDETSKKNARLSALRTQLKRLSTTATALPQPASPGDMFARLLRESPALVAPDPDAPKRVLPGQPEDTAYGPLHMVREWLEPTHCHGKAPVIAALDASSDLMAKLALDPGLQGVDPKKMLLIDTETTGLSTGAGTLPFLTGVAFFEDESLCVEQLLLTQRHHEPVMLRHLADRIADASLLVSYNGKSFDWPLLRSRFVMNRVPTPPLPPHLDLLHCARRAFKRRLRSMRLVEMEREILGKHRVDDVPGAAIPAIYLNYLRTGDPGRLDGVIEHNSHDLVALAAFLGEIIRRFREVQQSDDPRDHLSYALIAEKSGDPERAKAFSAAAAVGGGETNCSVEALLLHARIARRAKAHHDERKALLQALEHRSDPRVHLELAKHYEHRAKDLEAALQHAAQTTPVETQEEMNKRLARLRRRIARSQSAG